MTPTLTFAPQDTRTTSHPLRTRTVLLAAILAAECVALSHIPHPWFPFQQPAATPIVFLTALMFFGRDRFRSARLADRRIDRIFATIHVLALAVILATSVYLQAAAMRSWTTGVAIGLWSVSLLILFVSLPCALFAPRRLALTLSKLGPAWIFAICCALLAMSSRTLIQMAWNAPDSRFGQALTKATFHGVHSLLTLVYSDVISDPARNILGTPAFLVQVQGACSGMESLSLVLVLTVGWLIYARRELRVARAVWLVPIALCLMWLLNLVRIAALVAIGASGHPILAATGFHAEAGWILFNVVALSFLVAAQHVRWIRQPRFAPVASTGESLAKTTDGQPNQAALYLLPFLVIVAASLITQATSSGFEWLYPLRLLAASAVLWAFRASYRCMDWQFTWRGPVAGALVFALWLILNHAALGAPSILASSLATLPAWQRTPWLIFRLFAAVITVPIAEELAFRGYLARRIMRPNVEAVSFRSLTLLAILLSSVIFGLMHGKMALAGFAAGLVFALVARRTGRLGEAVSAHMTANLLLAVWVLARGDYALW